LVMSESGVSSISSFLPGKGEAYEFQTT
jgi:hypothetical protein